MASKNKIYIGQTCKGSDLDQKLQALAKHYEIDSIPELVKWIIITQYVEVRKNGLQRSKVQ